MDRAIAHAVAEAGVDLGDDVLVDVALEDVVLGDGVLVQEMRPFGVSVKAHGMRMVVVGYLSRTALRMDLEQAGPLARQRSRSTEALCHLEGGPNGREPTGRTWAPVRLLVSLRAWLDIPSTAESAKAPRHDVNWVTHPEVDLVPLPLPSAFPHILQVVASGVLPPSTVFTGDSILIVILPSVRGDRHQKGVYSPSSIQSSCRLRS